MDIKKYNTDHLSFSLHRVLNPGYQLAYQLVVQYDCEWILEKRFDSEEQVENFLKSYHKIFVKNGEIIRNKLYAYKQALCRDLKEGLEYVL